MLSSRHPALRLIGVAVSLAVVLFGVLRSRNAPKPSAPAPPPAASTQPAPAARPATDPAILDAIEHGRSKVWGIAAGAVVRLLSDDVSGNRHQRFIVRLESGATLLAEYNIDLAPRIVPLAVGDTVVMRGEYIWNDKGGLMHWLHHDPSGAPGGGWVRVKGREYK